MKNVNNPQTPRDNARPQEQPKTPREHPHMSGLRNQQGNDQLQHLTFELDKALYENNNLRKTN